MYNKKAQITIFVILGIILVSIVLLIIFNTPQKKSEPIDESISNKLKNYISSCSDLYAEDYISRALATGGHGKFPNHVVRTNENTYVISFSSEGIQQGIPNKENIKNFLLYEFKEFKTCVLSQINKEYETSGKLIILENTSYDFLIEPKAIIITYFYNYSYNGETFEESMTKRHITSLGQFLEETKRLTNMITETKEKDAFFNYQLCESIYENEGFLPRYSVDFLKQMENFEGEFLFEKDFFVIIIQDDDEYFPFAIMPLYEEPYC